MKKPYKRVTHARRLVLLAITALLLLLPSCVYMKMDPPADVDKAAHGHSATSTCWLATAANMLAGAGYGSGTTLQARADDIYKDLVAHFGTGSGWTDTALQWWLTSTHNIWTGNRYRLVTVYGNKTKIPWNNPNGARFIGTELRRCEFLGLSISWPVANSQSGTGGHAITCWGDNVRSESLTVNPGRNRVTDSDNDTGGDVQSYRYDSFTNPNPGGPNNGNGWYFNYPPTSFSSEHPFIKHIITLCPTDDPQGRLVQRVLGIYEIHQSNKTDATDLHYVVKTDAPILSYKTSVDWPTGVPPAITESQPRRSLSVDWDFSELPVPHCRYVTITTEFVLPYYNAIEYEDVHFTYKGKTLQIAPPELGVVMKTPELAAADRIEDVTGGYVITAFDIVNPNPTVETRLVGRYRFEHEYSFTQAPEKHELVLTGTPGYVVTNFRFGHSYGYLDAEELVEFKAWMTDLEGQEHKLGEEPITIAIEWPGRLPYPKGEDFREERPRVVRIDQ